jgi:hypothetical protein
VQVFGTVRGLDRSTVNRGQLVPRVSVLSLGQEAAVRGACDGDAE